MRLMGILLLAGTASLAQAGGPWRASERNTSGWSLMTPRERLEHQATVRAFTDLRACLDYQAAHQALMAARAQASGLQLKAHARDFCEHLRPPATPP
jgi:hypothetical protein